MDYINKFVVNIVNPVIVFLFALALVYFLYGLVSFMKNTDNAESKENGKQHMLWGIVGLAIMVSVYGIIRVVINSVHAEPPANIQNRL